MTFILTKIRQQQKHSSLLPFAATTAPPLASTPPAAATLPAAAPDGWSERRPFRREERFHEGVGGRSRASARALVQRAFALGKCEAEPRAGDDGDARDGCVKSAHEDWRSRRYDARTRLCPGASRFQHRHPPRRAAKDVSCVPRDEKRAERRVAVGQGALEAERRGRRAPLLFRGSMKRGERAVDAGAACDKDAVDAT